MDGSSLPAHRGALILVLGIVGIVGCQFLGPVAWVMGNNDLAAMNAGRMDPSGRGLTDAGRICGIIATVLLGLTLVAVVGMLVFGLVVGTAAATN